MSTKSSKLSKPTVIDLFCGAGGLGAAFEEAGFRVISAVDAEPDCIATLATNQSKRIPLVEGNGLHLEGTKLICKDIQRVKRCDLVPDGASLEWRPDVLVGGPPCQPFSSAGLGLGLDDPRGRLFREFVRLCDELQPKLVLFENVAGLVTAKGLDGTPGGVLLAIQDAFEAIGYICRFQLLNAADFGAPQRRVRLYMIASKAIALPDFPKPSHSATGDGDFLTWISLADCIGALPSADQTDVVRPSGKRAADILDLKPGSGLRSSGIVEANRPSGHWGYRQDCFMADLSQPSRTIRAASTPDWISTADGVRRLTWRECSALQDFPRSWCFVGTKASVFRQIGNAVQGHIGRAIASKLINDIYDHNPVQQQSSEQWPKAFYKRVRYTAAEERVNGAHRARARALRVLASKSSYGG